MFSRTRYLPALAFAAAIMLTACGGTDAARNTGPRTVDDRFPIKVGDRIVQMQIAAQMEEMQKGLMYRKSMGADEGMLFVYPAPTQMGFWMRNCEFIQNIGFFDAAGVLKETYEMYPHDERAVSSHAHDLQFALEMNQGWYERNGLKPGAKLDLKAVAEALRARGFKPETWGLK